MIKVTSLTSVSPLSKLSLNFQYLLFLGLVSAAPRPDGPPVYVPSEPYKAAPPPPRAYKPAPAPYKEEELPPQPYEYKYGVADDYSKSTYDKAETQDEYGNVQGSYKVRNNHYWSCLNMCFIVSFQINLPDGRVQIVNYVSDKDGFRADVNYEGTPVFPEPPPGGYGPYKGPGAYPGPKPGGYNTAPAVPSYPA